MSLDDIRDNWPILGAFAAGLVAWGETRRTAASAKDSSKKAHERVDAIVADVAVVKQAVARLETHAQYTRSGIDEIKEAIRDMRQA